jgi:hypothetical protein
MCTDNCAVTLTACAGACVDVKTDNANCGGCGIACTGGRTCTLGVCGCPLGTEECGDPAVCVNTTNNPNNCGACDKACDKGQICGAGDCKCPGGFESCPVAGGGDQCTNTQVDKKNCGQCGTVCNGACVKGMCK